MKAKTLQMKIKDLHIGFLRQLAGVSGQKYRDAHRCRANEKEGDCVDTSAANRHIREQSEAVKAFVEKYGNLTVGEYYEQGNSD